MHAMLRSAVALGVLMLSAGVAMAADPMPAVVFAPPAPAPIVTAPPGLLFVMRAGAWGGYRLLRSSDDPDDNNHFAWGADGAINIPFGQALSIQPEVRYWNYRDIGAEAPLGGLVAGGHISFRNPTRFLMGMFAAAAQPRAEGIDDNTPACCNGWGYLVGGEAQFYANQTTFYLQGGYGNIVVDQDTGPEGFVRGWFGQGEVRHFISDNFMIAGRIGFAYTPCYIDGLCAPAEDAGIFINWGATATMRLGSSPILVNVGYDGALVAATEDADVGREHTFFAGVTIELGRTNTLIDNDRRGATLTLPTGPVRLAAWNIGMD